MSQEMIEKMESLRLELAGLHRQIGSTQDHIDRGRPSPDLEKELIARMNDMEISLAEREKIYITELQTLRKDHPTIVKKWVALHLATVDEIINSPPPDDLKLSEKSLPVRLHVAKTTAQEWQEVLESKRDYVHINWYFLPDYEKRLRELINI